MKTTGVQKLAGVALILSVMLGGLWLARDKFVVGNTSAQVGVQELAMRRSYPGASFIVEFDYNNAYFGQADHGDVRLSADANAFVYVAPLAVQSDVYRILNALDGEPVARGDVEVSTLPSMPLIVSDVEKGKRISARYGDVHIDAIFEGGIATAQYRIDTANESIEIIFANGNATMSWRGVNLDGYGALTAEESRAMEEIATSSLAGALTMFPLDFGCVENPYDIPAEIYAAVLFPWQMILKYKVAQREPVVRHFLTASRCAFPGHLGPQLEKPQNVAIFWDADHSVPAIYDAFPFDGEGQYVSVPQ